MTHIDIIIKEDLKKAKQLYKYLQFNDCKGLYDSQLEDVINGEQPPAYGYRIKQTTNPLKYCHRIMKREAENPVTLEEFIERTVVKL